LIRLALTNPCSAGHGKTIVQIKKAQHFRLELQNVQANPGKIRYEK
jgi:hypothetical protein